jgi:hypothetical protein
MLTSNPWLGQRPPCILRGIGLITSAVQVLVEMKLSLFIRDIFSKGEQKLKARPGHLTIQRGWNDPLTKQGGLGERLFFIRTAQQDPFMPFNPPNINQVLFFELVPHQKDLTCGLGRQITQHQKRIIDRETLYFQRGEVQLFIIYKVEEVTKILTWA